ncbi:MAG: acetyl-CoA carboxylase biotin carboxyl carrier protein [Verrucomicrobiota bacterium]
MEDASLELKEIKQIVELMNKHELSYFHLEKGDFCIELKKGADFDSIQEVLASAASLPRTESLPASPPPIAPAAAPTVAAGPSAEPVDAEQEMIKAPMVGTFYRAATEGDEPFVKVGQAVEADTTVCLIEAMKTFNEIKAETSGVIAEICVENARPVQFEDPLFIIKPA